MAVNRDKPSEFGGRPTRSGIQPRIRPDGKKGHTMTTSEQLQQLRRAGTTEINEAVDAEKATWNGLLPKKEQTKKRKDEGALDKGVEF